MRFNIEQLKAMVDAIPKPSNTHPTKMPSTCEAEYHEQIGRLVADLIRKQRI